MIGYIKISMKLDASLFASDSGLAAVDAAGILDVVTRWRGGFYATRHLEQNHSSVAKMAAQANKRTLPICFRLRLINSCAVVFQQRLCYLLLIFAS